MKTFSERRISHRANDRRDRQNCRRRNGGETSAWRRKRSGAKAKENAKREGKPLTAGVMAIISWRTNENCRAIEMAA